LASAPQGYAFWDVDKLNGQTNSALADPKFKARLAETGKLIFANSPAEFRKFIVEEVKKWAKVIPMPQHQASENRPDFAT
jgi:tripartite-type tricarboxylate transporter receptor subunit TctC